MLFFYNSVSKGIEAPAQALFSRGMRRTFARNLLFIGAKLR